MCGPLFFHWGCAGDRLAPIPANSKGNKTMKLTKEQITEKREELCKVGSPSWSAKATAEKRRQQRRSGLPSASVRGGKPSFAEAERIPLLRLLERG